MTLRTRTNLMMGLILIATGVTIILAVFMLPLRNQIIVREYDVRKEVLHDLDEYDVELPIYFVSVYIERGRNIYTKINANNGFNFVVIPLEEWEASATNNTDYEKVYAKYQNVFKVDSYFNAPENGYYIFEVSKASEEVEFVIQEFQITSSWSELVERIGEEDYNYNVFYMGVFLGIIGLSITLYSLLPKLQPPGILRAGFIFLLPTLFPRIGIYCTQLFFHGR